MVDLKIWKYPEIEKSVKAYGSDEREGVHSSRQVRLQTSVLFLTVHPPRATQVSQALTPDLGSLGKGHVSVHISLEPIAHSSFKAKR